MRLRNTTDEHRVRHSAFRSYVGLCSICGIGVPIDSLIQDVTCQSLACFDALGIIALRILAVVEQNLPF